MFLGLAQYSGDPRIEWHLNTYSTKDAVVDAVKNLPYKGGNTLTGVGFLLIQPLCTVNLHMTPERISFLRKSFLNSFSPFYYHCILLPHSLPVPALSHLLFCLDNFPLFVFFLSLSFNPPRSLSVLLLFFLLLFCLSMCLQALH